jgi:divalent metal cation (Fe/Co/Zn/Cd) transporter
MKTNEPLAKTQSSALLRRGLLIEYSSLAWMTVEVLGALAAGVLAGSVALIAFGGDSIIELASSITVLIHLRTEDRGEGTAGKTERAERATLMLLFLLIPTIALAAVYAYLSGVEPEPSILGILITAGALIVMPVLWFEKHRIGRKANCFPIEVDATESSTCFLMSVALLVSLAANFLWRLWWADYVATTVIILFLAREAVESVHSFRLERGTSTF